MRIEQAQTNMLCERCGSTIIIERHILETRDKTWTEQFLQCSTAPTAHQVWQGPGTDFQDPL